MLSDQLLSLFNLWLTAAVRRDHFRIAASSIFHWLIPDDRTAQERLKPELPAVSYLIGAESTTPQPCSNEHRSAAWRVLGRPGENMATSVENCTIKVPTS